MSQILDLRWGLVVIGAFLLIYIIKNKNKLKKTILRRLTSGEKT